MSRAFNMRYTIARVRSGLEEAISQLTHTSASVPEALAKGFEAYNRQLTSVITLTGAAMLPTLNTKAGAEQPGGSQSVDTLLMRLLPRATAASVFTGDIVAFTSPLARQPQQDQNVLVRRVAAIEGAEMISDDSDDVPFNLPSGHCWVLADNEKLKPSEVIDSRSFGPLPFSSIIGRIVYYANSSTDHGAVENSDQASMEDRAVLATELDIDKLSQGQH